MIPWTLLSLLNCLIVERSFDCVILRGKRFTSIVRHSGLSRISLHHEARGEILELSPR